ncbi:MAG: hypothetical protein ACYDC3_16345 [Candidatus Binataceae bacterium]
MPRLSRAGQSLGVYASKLHNGWPMVWRSTFALLARYRPRIRARR